MTAVYPITNAATMIISQTSEVTFCKCIHSKWRQIISNIKKDGSVSYGTIQLRGKEDKIIVYLDFPSLPGLTWSYRTSEDSDVHAGVTLPTLDITRGLQIKLLYT